MTHAHILAKASDYSAGTLGSKDRAWLDRHLESCAECRSVFDRWKVTDPPVGLADRVMARLPGSGSVPKTQTGWIGRLPLWGTVAAAAMVAAAFWHPENGWVKSDKGFAVWYGPHTTSSWIQERGAGPNITGPAHPRRRPRRVFSAKGGIS